MKQEWWLVVGGLLGIVCSVVVLDYYGYIKHSSSAEGAVIEHFRLLSLRADQDTEISPKKSGKMAFCEQGFLLLKPDNMKKVSGILVDSKNRGIRCENEAFYQ